MTWIIERPLEYLVGMSSCVERVLDSTKTLWTLQNVDTDVLLYGDADSCFIFELAEGILHHIAARGNFYHTRRIDSVMSHSTTLVITPAERADLYAAAPTGAHYFNTHLQPFADLTDFELEITHTRIVVLVNPNLPMPAQVSLDRPDPAALQHLLAITAHHPRTQAMVLAYQAS
jgi:hypothetical protein